MRLSPRRTGALSEMQAGTLQIFTAIAGCEPVHDWNDGKGTGGLEPGYVPHRRMTIGCLCSGCDHVKDNSGETRLAWFTAALRLNGSRKTSLSVGPFRETPLSLIQSWLILRVEYPAGEVLCCGRHTIKDFCWCAAPGMLEKQGIPLRRNPVY